MTVPLPHDLDAERAVLGALMLGEADEADEAKVYDLLEPAVFYNAAHGAIFDACRSLYQEQAAVDEVAVGTRLRELGALETAGGAKVLGQLIEATPSASNVAHYARIVRDACERRRAHNTLRLLADDALDSSKPLATTLARIDELAHTAPSTDVLRGVSAGEALAIFDARAEGAVIATPFAELNRSLGGGWPVAQITTLLGYTGSYKSEICRQAGMHAVSLGHAFVHVDVELGVARIMQRRLVHGARILGSKLHAGAMLTRDELERLRAERERITADKLTKILCPGGGVPLPVLEAVLRRSLASAATAKPALVVLDSLQRLSTGAPGDTPRLQATRLMHWLEAFAHSQNAAFLLTGEQKRAADGRAPDAADVLTSGAESRSIEFQSDVLIGLAPQERLSELVAGPDDESFERRIELTIAKNRPTGSRGVLPVEIVFRTPFWDMSTQPRGVKDPDIKDKLYEALADGKPHSVKDLARAVHRRKEAIAPVLEGMEDVSPASGGGWILSSGVVPGPGTTGFAVSSPKDRTTGDDGDQGRLFCSTNADLRGARSAPGAGTTGAQPSAPNPPLIRAGIGDEGVPL